MLLGAAVGFRITQLIVRLRGEAMDRFKGICLMIIGTVAGTVFGHLSVAAAIGASSFRDGGVAEHRTFPVIKVTDDHDHSHWAIINPYGLPLPRGAMIPITKDDHQILRAYCVGRCRIPVCITVPIEHAPDGAVRVMVNDTGPKAKPESISDCKGNPAPVMVLTAP
ncbi:MAG: hypothetical protein EOP60_01140 [Sphingomonadales bacterium]|nr:MAG: hypothetical protein EOP60_01140 [Sphingomonadales bacterium]